MTSPSSGGPISPSGDQLVAGEVTCDGMIVNKIHVVIEDNKSLRERMQINADEVNAKNRCMSEFYKKMKGSSQKVFRILVNMRERIIQQQREIATLQSEKFRLEMGDLNSATESMAMNNGPPGENTMSEYKRILQTLENQLKKSENEKLNLKKEFDNKLVEVKNAWDRREAEIMALQTQAALREQSRVEQVNILIKENNSYSTELQRYKDDLESMEDKIDDLEKVDDELSRTKSILEHTRDEIERLKHDEDRDPNTALSRKVVCLEKELQELKEQLNLHKEQGEIFKKDFELERKERQKVHTECNQYKQEMRKMKDDITRYQARQIHDRP